MSASNSNPRSIFTAKEAFSKKPTEPTRQRTPTRVPRTSSPFRRQSTPDALEKNRVQAAVEAAPFATTLPENSLPHTASVGIAKEELPTRKEPSAHTTVWESLASDEKQRERADPPLLTAKGRSTSTSHLISQTPPAPTPSSAGNSCGRKRSGGGLSYEEAGPLFEPSSKRPRLRPKSKHFLDGFSFRASRFEHSIEPPSPLFFSHSPRPRPLLPPRFSSSEAAAKMLSKARTEDSHIKTVSLARGVVSNSGLPMATSAPQPPSSLTGRRSLDRSMTGRSNSPDSSHGRDLGGVLNSIGIVELLEQDERPTFIVDLGDSSNYGMGRLQVVFANSALKYHTGLELLVTGLAPEDASPGPKTFLQFKSWLLGAAVNGESLDVCLPSFVFVNMSWSCSTLRKRLRIISGTFLATPSSGKPSMPPTSVPPTTTLPLESAIASSAPTHEPGDYFSGATTGQRPPSSKSGEPSDGSSTATTEAMSTIEEPLPSSGARSVLIEANGNLFPTDPDLSGATDLLPSNSSYVPHPADYVPDKSSPSSVDRDSNQILVVPSDAPSFDWTRLPISDSMPKHIQFARSIDWASTSLGPIETWSSDLRQMCNLIMASPHPAAMYWGDDLIAIYNEAYILLAGQKHPHLMGQSYREAWVEIWDEVKDVFASARTTGEATMKDDDCLFIKRNNYLEETYFSWSIIPMVGRDGSVMGLYNPAFEKTRRKIAERRMLTLREVGERTASARDVKAFWAQVLSSFEFNEYDSPFLLLYSVAEENDSDTSSIHSNSVFATRQCLLEGSLGVPEGHPAAPGQIDLKTGMEGFGPVFREVMKTDRPVLLEVGSRDLPEGLLEGLEWRGFGDPVRANVVCPIHITTGENILGFLVLGINPRRPYDDDYSLFVQLLTRQLATSLASVVLFEEEIRRGQKAAKLAALDRMELSEQLAARTQEAIESETKFTRMAEYAPVGMFIADQSGKITFANDTWYEISRVPKNSTTAETWMEAVMPEDHSKVKQLWEDLIVGTRTVNAEFRFKAPWEDRSGTLGETWVLFSGFPEKYDDGRLKSIFGSITNISQQKWAEGIQTRKMEEAVELKRQQENFIDITSHEMRNPLSAILQCSDEIATSLTRFRQSGDRALPDDLLTSCLDAAQIISLCSQHQKRIVDDILTLSKLDSQLLLVTPVDAQPLTVVQRALKMHEGELQAADIQMKFIVDQSFRDLDLDWVRFDPSRVLQVLINLTTNAIKFTGTESKRTISVTISASKKRPGESNDAPVEYFPSRRKGQDTMDEKDWGDGEKLYIHFSVRDTGRGLNAEEKKMLFMRFSQASPRTHVQYGGSGLGLFISRELTELQGGEIGVESESGKGSTFAFYVVARRSTAPPDTDGGTGIKHGSTRPEVRSKSVPSAQMKRSSPRDAPQRPTLVANGSAKEIVRRVLIVEDNLVNQRVLQKQLKNMGTEVHLANHGGEALEKLRQSTYWAEESTALGPKKLELGVVLMDQEMPVMDGLTCTKTIRELENEGKLTGHVPIIAVTANARAEQVQTALDTGMVSCSTHPLRDSSANIGCRTTWSRNRLGYPN